jgi:hypothetical protein
MEHYLWLIPWGFAIGAYGTLIGAGGGFVLVPFLLLLYPKESPEIIASISLAVVFFNALSGSVAYARMGRIDYKSGLLLSVATIPGAILGAITTAYIPRRAFDALLGLLMVTASGYLIFSPNKKQGAEARATRQSLSRSLVEADGTAHTFSYNPILGVGVSVFVGYLSSLLGIGGGVIHVPVLAHLLNFPIHIATATSHFILAIMALTGTIVHIATGVFSHGVRRTIALTVGVLVGAQMGAWLSNRVQEDWIIRGLAIALGFVGVRVLMMAL